MKAKLLSKLISVKKNEINALRADHLNLTNIVDQLQSDFSIEQQRSKAFSDAYFGDSNKVNHVDELLNSRYFFRNLHDTSVQMLRQLNEAQHQRDAAYNSLNGSAVELRVLEKLEDDLFNNEQLIKFHQEQVESDLLAILTFNRIQA